MAMRPVVANHAFPEKLEIWVKSPSFQAPTVNVNNCFMGYKPMVSGWFLEVLFYNFWTCQLLTAVNSPRLGGSSNQMWAKITCQSVCNFWLLHEMHRICVKLGVGRAWLNTGDCLFSDQRQKHSECWWPRDKELR